MYLQRALAAECVGEHTERSPPLDVYSVGNVVNAISHALHEGRDGDRVQRKARPAKCTIAHDAHGRGVEAAAPAAATSLKATVITF